LFAVYHQAQNPPPFQEQVRQALAEPFKGVTTDGKVVPGLFNIRSTGVTTKPVRLAAEAFLKSLSEAQRKKMLFSIDDDEWRKWDNRHSPPRQGFSFAEMSEAQRALAFRMIGAGLSARGLQKTQDIMKLNETIGEITGRFAEYGQWKYWVTMMGTPSDKQPWGWQFDGHHCIINYFVLGDQVVMTPTFMGSEPVKAEAGKFKGVQVMQDEQNKGAAMLAALDKDQQAKAILRNDKGQNFNLSEAYRDNLVLDYAGLPAAQMNAKQKAQLLDLIGEYVSNMAPGHARIRMDEVRRHLDRTYFAWIGGTDPHGLFYYRVHSPVILIEFDHQRPVALPRSPTPIRDHIHTVVRTPNGNDYGKDLLRQHHEQHPHGGKHDHLKK
jgi:hypothetical protein